MTQITIEQDIARKNDRTCWDAHSAGRREAVIMGMHPRCRDQWALAAGARAMGQEYDPELCEDCKRKAGR